MGRGYRSLLFAEPNTWHADEHGCVWEYGNYRYCYLVIRLDGQGKYVPSLGAFTDLGYKNIKTPSCGHFAFNTLEEAKEHLFKYVDYVRDENDQREKKILHASLHDKNPGVYT